MISSTYRTIRPPMRSCWWPRIRSSVRNRVGRQHQRIAAPGFRARLLLVHTIVGFDIIAARQPPPVACAAPTARVRGVHLGRHALAGLGRTCALEHRHAEPVARKRVIAPPSRALSSGSASEALAALTTLSGARPSRSSQHT